MSLFRQLFLNARFDELVFTPPQGLSHGHIFFDYPCDVQPYHANYVHAMYDRRVVKLKNFESRARGPYYIFTETGRNKLLPDFVSFVISEQQPDNRIATKVGCLDDAFKHVIMLEVQMAKNQGRPDAQLGEELPEQPLVKSKRSEDAQPVVNNKDLVCPAVDISPVRLADPNEVLVDRFLNGTWVSVGVGNKSFSAIYMAGSDPLRVAGRPGFDLNTRRNLFTEFCQDLSDAGNPPIWINFTKFRAERHLILDVSRLPGTDQTFGPFNDIYLAIQWLTKNMNEGGNIVEPENQPEPISIEDKWNLGKETYTKAEVIELMGMMKAEMVESTGQLFDRMLGRINTDKRS